MAMKVFSSLRKLFPSLAVLAVGLSIAGSTVKADAILFDPDGIAPTNPAFQVGSFGFETGNTLAQAAISGGNLLPPGSTFQLFLQTRLTNLTASPGGGTITPLGLNGVASPPNPAYEITLTASITERVLTSGAGTATFQTNAVQNNSFIRLFYDTTPDSSNFTGVGFADGLQILSATPSASLVSSGDFTVSVNQQGQPVGVSPFDTFDTPGSAPGIAYAGLTSVTGSGGAIISAIVNSFDSTFFLTPVNTVRFDAFDNVPFNQTTPSQFFNGSTNTPTVAANRGPVNGVSGPDFQFQSRTSAAFTAVPEPASVGMMALGVVSVLGYTWRKRRQAV